MANNQTAYIQENIKNMANWQTESRPETLKKMLRNRKSQNLNLIFI